ncbi:MAG: hypothetical protein PHP97_01505 [Candidatus Shapirobacteria bacterium]|nr:hypothetical protein [Candidatus Shapirobacteria bacterium]MDD3002860.1 hypothetical protein [Candidatus Shapirobacteria bacterium]MDD4382934.1 hypothetical protein [Candidatus Shapirobacteria bacterium]
MNNKIIFGLIWIFGLIVAVFVISKSVLALNLVIHIPEKYLEVTAGDRLTFELEVKYPENPSRKDLRLTYQIKKGDEIISESKVLKAIETQSSFMDYMTIPESLEVGTYTIANKVQDYQNLNEEVSANFRVVKGKADLMKYIYILGVAIGIVDVLVIIEFWMISRMRKKNEK